MTQREVDRTDYRGTGLRRAVGLVIHLVISGLSRPLRLVQHAPRPFLPPLVRAAPRLPLPTFSVAIPTLNQVDFVETALTSVLEQEVLDLEVVLQDGGSTDGTLDVIERYAPRLASAVSEPDFGQADAINRAFTRTTGDIMGWVNSDDMLLPGALSTVGKFFATHADVDVVYGWRLIMDDAGLIVGRWVVPATTHSFLDWADYIPQETLFWRRSLWDRVGGSVDASLHFALDWDLLLRFVDAGAMFACIPAYLGAFRVHNASKTVANIDSVGEEEMLMLRKKRHGRVPSPNEITRALLPLYGQAWVARLFRQSRHRY